jgi:hypothetical protein
MSKPKRSRKQQHDFWMDDPIGAMTTLLQMSQGCTMEKAYEQTVRDLSDLLQVLPARPAQSTGFDDADTIRARGMGVSLC